MGEKIPFVSDIARTTVCVIMTATLDPFMDGRQLERAQPGIRCRHRKRKKNKMDSIKPKRGETNIWLKWSILLIKKDFLI